MEYERGGQLGNRERVYHFFKEDILDKNYHMLFYSSCCSAFISAGILAVNAILRTFDFYTNIVYLIWILISGCLGALCMFTSAFVRRHATLILYFYTSVIFFTAIISGTLLSLDHPSGVVIGLIAILPFILFDRQWRFCVYEGLISAVFCLLSLSVKKFSVAVVDCYNAVGFTILSCVIGVKTIELKLSELNSKFVITAQRDTDQLTGIMARASAERAIEAYCMQSGEKAALFIIDIDHFKAINDTFGHGKGDDVLVDVARKIKECFRQTDITARLGGDEFIAFVSGTFDISWIRARSEELNRVIACEVKMNGKTCRITASIGVALFDGNQNFESLYAQADEMLYKVKEGGRDGYRIFGDAAGGRN